MKNTIFILTLFVAFLHGDTLQVFSLMNSTGSVVSKGFNGGGSALLQGPQSITVNPALISTWQRMYGKRFAVQLSGGKVEDDGLLLGGAASFELAPENFIAADFTYKDPYKLGDSNKEKSLTRATIAISGPIVKEKEEELALGIGLSYHNFSDEFALSPLTVNTVSSTSDDGILSNTTTSYNVDTLAEHAEHVLTMDIGFFQLDLNKSMTFSLVAENLLGYRWLKTTPKVEQRIDTISEVNADTLQVVDSAYYASQEYGTKWLNGNFKSLLIGGTSRIPIKSSDMIVNIPLDLRFWRFLSKELNKDNGYELKDRVEVYTGVEVFKGSKFGARFGYAWKTPKYRTDENGMPLFEPQHTFSGGVTLKVKDFLIDGFWADGSIGGGLTLGF